MEIVTSCTPNQIFPSTTPANPKAKHLLAGIHACMESKNITDSVYLLQQRESQTSNDLAIFWHLGASVAGPTHREPETTPGFRGLPSAVSYRNKTTHFQ